MPTVLRRIFRKIEDRKRKKNTANMEEALKKFNIAKSCDQNSV
jgi:hypothetical protein